MRLGGIELRGVSGGTLRIDGGTMFGMVPKVLWQRLAPADERNRIRLDTNCVLVRAAGKTLLIDTGYGSKADARQRENFALQEGNPLLVNLAAMGVRPGDVDMVVLTHLHFDHAGGCTLRDEAGRLRPTFPGARHVVQRAEWEDATAGLPELTGAYMEEDVLPLEEAGVVELVERDVELLPGVAVRLTGGHTRGHQAIVLGDGGQQAIYLGDTCPTAAHLPTFWHMSYEQYPLALRRIKPRLLEDAAENHTLVLFDHDPDVKAAYLARDEKGQVAVGEVVGL